MEKKYKFSFHDLVLLLFKNKECPYCGNFDLKRESIKDYKKSKEKLGEVDVIENKVIYKCKVCGRRYSEKGLKDSVELDPDDDIVTDGNEIKERLENSKIEFNIKGEMLMRRITIIWSIIASFIVIFLAIALNNCVVILFFTPFIITSYLMMRFFRTR